MLSGPAEGLRVVRAIRVGLGSTTRQLPCPCRQRAADAVRALAAARQVQEAPGPHAGRCEEAGRLLPQGCQGAPPALSTASQLPCQATPTEPAGWLAAGQPRWAAHLGCQVHAGAAPCLQSWAAPQGLALPHPGSLARRTSACCSTTTGTACRGRPPTARCGCSTRATRSTFPCPCSTCSPGWARPASTSWTALLRGCSCPPSSPTPTPRPPGCVRLHERTPGRACAGCAPRPAFPRTACSASPPVRTRVCSRPPPPPPPHGHTGAGGPVSSPAEASCHRAGAGGDCTGG